MSTTLDLESVKKKLPPWEIPRQRLPPYSNRGVNCPSIHVDALTFTFKIDGYFKRYQRSMFFLFFKAALGFKNLSLPVLSRRVGDQMQPDFSKAKGNGRHGYESGLRVYSAGAELCSMFWGGNEGTMMIELHGAFCQKVPTPLWDRLACFLGKVNRARITRCDLAADFYQGELCVRCANDVFRVMGPEFLGIRCGGRLPKGKFIDGGYNGSTLEIGTRTSGRQIVIYEKGRQLGFFGEPWTRAEVRFRRYRSGFKQYEVPLDILRPDNWWSYWASSADYLARLTEVAKQVQIGSHDVGYDAFLDYLQAQAKSCSKQYGGLIGFLESKLGPLLTCRLLGHSRWQGFKLFPEAEESTAEEIKMALMAGYGDF